LKYSKDSQRILYYFVVSQCVKMGLAQLKTLKQMLSDQFQC